MLKKEYKKADITSAIYWQCEKSFLFFEDSCLL